MDTDLIRLILLILGIALVAGIWLWDRRQRGQGEPPMVRLRERDEPEPLPAVDDEPDDRTDERSDDHPDRAATPPVYLDPDDAPVRGADDEPQPAAPVTAAPERPAAPSVATAAEPSPSKVEGRPAWVQPSEPVIPAFLMATDRQLLAEAARDERAAVAAAAAESAPSRPVPPAPADEPSLLLDADHEPDIPVLELAADPLHTPARPTRAKARESAPKAAPAEPVNIRVDEDQIDLDLGFSAMDDQDLQEVAVELPELIVQINIVAKGAPFSGEQILAAMDQVEMRAGEHDIFHRYDNQGKRKSLFSLASLVEPGNFPLKKMKDFSSPGLTLFTQLPGPRDGLLIFSDMLYVAERLARLLDARLKDASRSTLTRQTIEHTRERIAEHKRQITLKLRQAGDKHRGRR